MSRVDPVSGRVVASVSTGPLPIGDAAITAGAGSLWVADWDAGTLRRINPLTNRQVAEVPVPADVRERSRTSAALSSAA